MKIDLSRKRHHTFEQVANVLQCTIEDLRYYVIEGELFPSLYLSGQPLRTYLMLPGEHYETSGHVIPEEQTSTNELDHGAPQTALPRGFFHLVLGRQTSTFDCEFEYAATQSFGFDIGDVIFKLETPLRLAEVFETCVVMGTELERFKASHSFLRTLSVESGPTSNTSPEKAWDPSDLPEELDAANLSFRAVSNGYGDATATHRNRIVAYLNENYPTFTQQAIDRIATVANPDKSPGRKKNIQE